MASCGGEARVKIEVSPEAWRAVIEHRDKLDKALRRLIEDASVWFDEHDEEIIRARLALLYDGPCAESLEFNRTQQDWDLAKAEVARLKQENADLREQLEVEFRATFVMPDHDAPTNVGGWGEHEKFYEELLEALATYHSLMGNIHMLTQNEVSSEPWQIWMEAREMAQVKAQGILAKAERGAT